MQSVDSGSISGKTPELKDGESASFQERRLGRAVEALTAISAPSKSSADFFATCVQQLAKAYGTRFAFIGLFDENAQKTQVTTIAGFANGELIPSVTYPLYGSPCQDVLCVKKVFIPDGLMERYPEDELLIEMKLESYFGSALTDPSGEPIGLVIITDTEPMSPDSWNDPLLDLFADRISYELERAQAEEELRLAASVFQGSHDGVLIMEPDWTIRKVNQAFEDMTGWTEREVLGEHALLLRSERHDDKFFRDKTIQLLKTGFWREDVWITQKNRKILPVRCSVTAVKDPVKDQIVHYVMMITDISEKKYAEQRIQRLAYFDTITELPNRTHFIERLNRTLGKSRNTERPLSVMLLDLDGFKAVNDRLGHSGGDKLLSAVGDRLLSLSSEDCFCARLGGDEFAVLFQSPDQNRDSVDQMAASIVQLLSEPYILDGETETVSASIGIACYPKHGKDAQSLMRNADLATYHAKAQGRNRFEHYHDELCEKAEKAAALQALLRCAISKDQFRMAYQTRHCVGTGKLIGSEALLRWQLDDGAHISPAQFIPIAEETGLIEPIGDWVLTTVFHQLSEWNRVGVSSGMTSINVSGRQLLSPEFSSKLASLVKETGVAPGQVELEITETWLMEDPNRSVDLLRSLKAMGFKLAIDDFGVAYSSMNYLKHFPIDTIKIDRSFTRDINTEENSLAIISAIVAMGRSLGLNVLAEGVETEAQLKTLHSTGCDECQGYYFSRPMAEEEFTALLNNGHAVMPKRSLLGS
ncbi:bifunctional diguanylate cyclase/phosphodiesterase [Coralliovum pocilloporae]|uniref:bifunctional diguanylate cyclase/phosphodiesterase n=1 Tax=Coralliovum pocilloporae TaxID=3066369 RepID=UPI003306F1E1